MTSFCSSAGSAPGASCWLSFGIFMISDKLKDLLREFARGEIGYEEFAARTGRRELGMPEDFGYDV